MARLIWVGVGAVGGIYAYRRGERVVEAVREQGVVGTAQVLASAASQRIAARTSGGAPRVDPARGIRIGGVRISLAEDAPSVIPMTSAIPQAAVVDITDARHQESSRRHRAR